MRAPSSKASHVSSHGASHGPNPESEWFGMRRVTPAEKTGAVGAVFRSVAPRYDLMNDLMSFGLHRFWKRALIAATRPKDGQWLLDVAAGTGDIARAWLHAAGPKARAVLCDRSEAMLGAGVKPDAAAHGSRVVSDAASLPIADGVFDTATISFGLRNVTAIDDALSSMTQCLRPGGKFFCLEFAPVDLPIVRKLYDVYSFAVLPRLGGWVAGDAAAYRYLAESIRQFPPPEKLAARMQAAGLRAVRFRPLNFGVCYLHEGVRP